MFIHFYRVVGGTGAVRESQDASRTVRARGRRKRGVSGDLRLLLADLLLLAPGRCGITTDTGAGQRLGTRADALTTAIVHNVSTLIRDPRQLRRAQGRLLEIFFRDGKRPGDISQPLRVYCPHP